MTTTPTRRAELVKAIGEMTDYDPDTVRLAKDGRVTAILDADKTFNGPHTTRAFVGYADDLLTEYEDRKAWMTA